MTGTEQVLIEDWCQQYPSHSVGALAFGADGELYVTGGDGASFTLRRLRPGRQLRSTRAAIPRAAPGQRSRRRRPRAARCAARTCARPAIPSASTARSSASIPPPAPAAGQPARRQRRRQRAADHRLRPAQPVPVHDPPGHQRGLARRRRAGTRGRRSTASPIRSTAIVENFGWPCYEGDRAPAGLRRRQPEHLREPSTARPGAVTPPVLRLRPRRTGRRRRDLPDRQLLDRRACVRFYQRRRLPGRVQRRALLRRLLARLHLGDASGRQRPARPGHASTTFVTPARRTRSTSRSARAATLYYVDFDGGTIRRIRYFSGNQPPTAVASATPTAGRRRSPSASTAAAPATPTGRHADLRLGSRRRRRVRRLDARRPRSHTYTRRAPTRSAPGHRQPRRLGHATRSRSTPATRRPTRRSTRPTSALTWKVGDTIAFSGSATRPRRTARCRPRAFRWSLIMHHCPSNCHTHPLQTLRRRRRRLVHGARPRVPVASRAAADGDRFDTG